MKRILVEIMMLLFRAPFKYLILKTYQLCMYMVIPCALDSILDNCSTSPPWISSMPTMISKL